MSEKTMAENVKYSFHNLIPLWISTQLEANALMQRYEKYAESNQLAGNLTELCIWAATELLRSNEIIPHYVYENILYRWREPALAVVIKNENGNLLLPTIKTSNEKLSLEDTAEIFLGIKKKIVTNKLSAKDMDGGGLLIPFWSNQSLFLQCHTATTNKLCACSQWSTRSSW